VCGLTYIKDCSFDLSLDVPKQNMRLHLNHTILELAIAATNFLAKEAKQKKSLPASTHF